jgi:hypothetical protein
MKEGKKKKEENKKEPEQKLEEGPIKSSDVEGPIEEREGVEKEIGELRKKLEEKEKEAKEQYDRF